MQSDRLVLNDRANGHLGNGKNHIRKHKLFNHWFFLHRFLNRRKKHIHTTIIKSHGSPLLVRTSSFLEQLLEKEAQHDIWAAIYNCIQLCLAAIYNCIQLCFAQQEWGRMGCTYLIGARHRQRAQWRRQHGQEGLPCRGYGRSSSWCTYLMRTQGTRCEQPELLISK
jgi:hypothetical protein